MQLRHTFALSAGLVDLLFHCYGEYSQRGLKPEWRPWQACLRDWRRSHLLTP